MKLTLFVCAVLVLWMPMAAFADSVNVSDINGTITASMSNDLTLTGSVLTGLSGLAPAYDCGTTGFLACSGSVGLTTGHTLITGTLITSATFGGSPAGSDFGNILVINNSGSGGGIDFSGSFSKATWTNNGSGSTAFWVFVGTIADGTLTLGDGSVYTGIDGASVQLTSALGGPQIVNGHNTWGDAGGSTTFPSPVPEPGTLTLLGSGLVVMGVLARRRRSGKAIASN